jgi:hypothetical protein
MSMMHPLLSSFSGEGPQMRVRSCLDSNLPDFIWPHVFVAEASMGCCSKDSDRFIMVKSTSGKMSFYFQFTGTMLWCILGFLLALGLKKYPCLW